MRGMVGTDIGIKLLPVMDGNPYIYRVLPYPVIHSIVSIYMIVLPLTLTAIL